MTEIHTPHVRLVSAALELKHHIIALIKEAEPSADTASRRASVERTWMRALYQGLYDPTFDELCRILVALGINIKTSKK